VKCGDPNDPTTASFTCQRHPDENGKTRCLQYCTTSSDCRAGRICLSGGTRHNYCADAPYLAIPADSSTSCIDPGSVFDQLVTYKVNAGGSFTVSGSATGLLASNTSDANGNCIAYTTTFTATPPDKPQRDWRLVGRIPLSKTLGTDGSLHDVPHCSVLDVDADGKRISHDKSMAVVPDDNTTAPQTSDKTPPNLESEVRMRPLRALATNLPDDPCQFWGGAIPSESPIPMDQPVPRHARAFFENNEISFVLANIDRAPTSELTIPFDINGGSAPQFVLYPSTVEVSEAARIVLGPIDSLPQTAGTTPLFEAPYLFVVDQRRLGRAQGGGPTRGQLVRINPIGYSVTIGNAMGVQPTYEDYTRSGNLFPIQ